ncbi:MAG TPA: ABC transporter permease [Gammaproteobacteria bacterium]|nr:ABC transporter permease [Gammaproteobacteria bacterium]
MTNWRGLYTVFRKEVMRFLKVTVQTVLTPVVTALLYLVVFAQALASHVQVYPGISYTAFLIPGLIMMSVIQNAFANSSSSLIQSKMTGNLVFLLLSPVSPAEFVVAFVSAAVLRGLMVGLGVYLVAQYFVHLPVSHLGWSLLFALLGSAFLGGLGVVAGVSSDKFEQLAAFQNFIILPLSFLSGVFYSIHSLPSPWDAVSRFNPFFYIIDGFRFGVLGVSDVSPWLSLSVAGGFVAAILTICLVMLNTGYKLRQ